MGKARIKAKDEAGGSQAGENRVKRGAAGSFYLIAIGVPNLWPVELSVSECSLNDSYKGRIEAIVSR